MSENLPDNVSPFVEHLPKNLSIGNVTANIEKFRGMYGDDYVNSIIWTAEDAKGVLGDLGIQSTSALYSFYQNAFELPQAYRNEELFGLSQIRDDFNKPFWGDKYKNIQDKFLLISSTEGEHSYFYDKNADSVYGVGWEKMDELLDGTLDPLFSSFFDFFIWYFTGEDE